MTALVYLPKGTVAVDSYEDKMSCIKIYLDIFSLFAMQFDGLLKHGSKFNTGQLLGSGIILFPYLELYSMFQSIIPKSTACTLYLTLQKFIYT